MPDNMSSKVSDKSQSSRNVRTALILAALALLFFVGMFVRMAFFPH